MIETSDDLVDHQGDENYDQHDDLLPAKPKIEPIIAPDMFPP